MKAAARPELFDTPGPGANKIALGHLKNPSPWSHPDTKGGNIPGGMHGLGGPSGEIHNCTEMTEDVGPAILGAFYATEKVGTLMGGRPDENIHRTENIFQGVKISSGAPSVAKTSPGLCCD